MLILSLSLSLSLNSVLERGEGNRESQSTHTHKKKEKKRKKKKKNKKHISLSFFLSFFSRNRTTNIQLNSHILITLLIAQQLALVGIHNTILTPTSRKTAS